MRLLHSLNTSELYHLVVCVMHECFRYLYGFRLRPKYCATTRKESLVREPCTKYDSRRRTKTTIKAKSQFIRLFTIEIVVFFFARSLTQLLNRLINWSGNCFMWYAFGSRAWTYAQASHGMLSALGVCERLCVCALVEKSIQPRTSQANAYAVKRTLERIVYSNNNSSGHEKRRSNARQIWSLFANAWRLVERSICGNEKCCSQNGERVRIDVDSELHERRKHKKKKTNQKRNT